MNSLRVIWFVSLIIILMQSNMCETSQGSKFRINANPLRMQGQITLASAKLTYSYVPQPFVQQKVKIDHCSLAVKDKSTL